jgi:hypothetical protein
MIHRRKFQPAARLEERLWPWFRALLFVGFGLTLALGRARADNVVTFNEIHYHPTAAQPGGEWIELKNQYAVNVDMSGWRLTGGVDFVFPAGTVIPAGGYFVIAANPGALQTAAGISGVFGPFTGTLANGGERIVLQNNSGRVMDEIDYGTDGAWPSGPDGGGPSLAKRREGLPSGDSASWRASKTSTPTPGAENFPAFLPPVTTALVALNASWKYLANGADPGGTWKDEAFDDTAWSTGSAGFQLGSNTLPAGVTAGTALPSGPVTYYFRRTFIWNGSVPQTTLKLKLVVDDGAAAYLNGTELVRTNLPDGPINATTKAVIAKRSAPVLQEFVVPSFTLHGGTNVLAVEAHQAGALAQGAAMLYYAPVATPATARLDGNYTVGSRLRVSTSQQLTHLGVQDADAAVDANDPDGADGLTGFADDDGFLAGSVQVGLWNTAGTLLASATVVSGDPHFAGWRYKAVTPVTLAANTDYYIGARVGTGVEWFLDSSSGTPIFAAEAGVSLTLNTYASGAALARPATDGSLTIGRWGAANALLGAPSVFTVAGDTTDAVFAAELVATEAAPVPPSTPFVFNEVSTGGVELMSLGAAASSAGLTVARVTASGIFSNPVPAENLATGGFQQVALALADGDRVVLYAADGVTVLDSFEVKASPRSRSPDGTGAWLRPVALTPGAANQVALSTAIVINEIMFDPPAAAFFPPGTPRAGKWIELRNRSGGAVDLSGWALANGVDFSFPAGTVLAAGGYLVVAESPSAVIAAHGLPAAQVLGPWSGNLSGGGERLVLNDALGNPADEVRYAAGGRWPEAADGGGSSLELRDANADNSSPEAWAASDQTHDAGWQTFTWSGANTPSQTGEPTLWHELNLLLVDGPGEVLIDDVRVTDTTTSANLIQNGDFSAGAAHWRLLGNHGGSVIGGEPGNLSNQVLHLIASGAGEYQGNQIETTFLNNQALVDGRTYEISLRARWLSGGGRLNTRLYFNRLPRTNVLAVTPNGGTPGAANSQAVANLGPTFKNLAHSPTIPASTQPVVISVDAADPQGIATASVKYAVAGGPWQSAAMSAAGTDGAHFTATLPGQSAGTTVQFYIEAQDTAGAVSSFPSRGASSRALYVVNDGQGGSLPALRLVMTTADATFLHTPVNTLSNEFLGATVIADGEVYYDAGVRLKGSFVGRNVARVGFNLRFGPDQLFRGTYDKIAVDRSQHAAIGVSEILTKHIATAAGGIPGMYDDLTYFIHPLGGYTSNALLRLAAFDEIYLDSQFPSGSDGRMFEVEVLRWNLATVDGNPESRKLPGNESGGTGATNLELQGYGDGKEAYRWNALQAMHRDEDDYTGLIAFEKMFGQTGATFATTAGQLLDVDAFLRTLAYQSLVGPGDAVYTGGSVHNFRLYLRPNDGRALYLPWDWDSSWTRSTSGSLIGTGNIAKAVTASADLTRRYHAQLYDLVATTYNTAAMAPWTAHYGARSGQDFSGILTYIGQRATYVLGQLPTSTSFSAAAGAVSTNGAGTITGTANIQVTAIEVNGILYTPVWSSNTAWSITVPLVPNGNALAIRGIDAHGKPVSGATSTVNVNNPYVSGWPALKFNEWLAENDGAFPDPADGHSDDWFELYNPTASAVSLADWKLSDLSTTPFTVPAGWSIPAHGYLLVWADNEPVQNPATPTTGSALHVNFKLSNAGETLRLTAPDNTVVDLLTFGPQHANQAEGRVPDGAPTITALTLPTPGGANALTVLTPLALGPGASAIRFTTTPGLHYTLEKSDNLTTWTNVSPAQIAAGAELTITDPAPALDKRFYRVRVAP